MASGSERDRLIQQARQHLLFYQEMGLEAVPRPAPAPARRAAPDPAPQTGQESAAGAALLELREIEIGDCRRCKLCAARQTIVFGDGSPDARLMFVGEGPGADEDRQGLPFVGRAGQLLNDIIKAMGYARKEVYIANVVKCRPPENRTPQPDEVAACTPFLFKQIELIQPRVIVALGSPAAQSLLGTTAGITKIRGTFREYNGIRVMPTFHPAYLLRNPAAKREVWDDMQQVMAYLST